MLAAVLVLIVLVLDVFVFRFFTSLRDFRFVALIFFDVLFDRFLGEIYRVFLDLPRKEIIIRVALVSIEHIDKLVAFGNAGFRDRVRVGRIDCRIARRRTVRGIAA